MAKDVAQREIDLAGFRISNLGNPAAVGDVTKTDNLTALLAGRRNASAGTSLLAAAADHIHPLEPDLIELSDPALQIVAARPSCGSASSTSTNSSATSSKSACRRCSRPACCRHGWTARSATPPPERSS